MNTANSNDRSTDPCTILDITGSMQEMSWSTTVYCEWPLKKLPIHFSDETCSVRLANAASRSECGTFSSARWKSNVKISNGILAFT